MTISNRSANPWHDVFAFNWLNPTGARDFQDWNLERTFMSSHGRPLLMARTKRVQGHMPATSFGDIGPGESSSTVARLYLAEGGLDEFLARFQSDRETLQPRQAWARPRRP